MSLTHYRSEKMPRSRSGLASQRRIRRHITGSYARRDHKSNRPPRAGTQRAGGGFCRHKTGPGGQLALALESPGNALEPRAAVLPSLEVASSANTPAAVVLNATPSRGDLTPHTADAIREMGATLCPVSLGARVAHVRAFTAGCTAQETEPRSRVADELEALYRWTQEHPAP